MYSKGNFSVCQLKYVYSHLCIHWMILFEHHLTWIFFSILYLNDLKMTWNIFFKRTTRHISRKSGFLHKFFINTVNFIWSFTKFDTYLNWSMHNMKIFHVIQIQSFFMEETCNNTCVFMFITAINCYNSRALHVLFPPYLF